MGLTELAEWEENFCLPFYKGGWKDLNTVYMDTQRFYAGCSENGLRDGTTWDLRNILRDSLGRIEPGLRFGTDPQAGAISPAVTGCGEVLSGSRTALDVGDSRTSGWHRANTSSLEEMLQEEGFQLAMEAQAVVAESKPAIADSKLVIKPALTNGDWETIAAVNAE